MSFDENVTYSKDYNDIKYLFLNSEKEDIIKRINVFYLDNQEEKDINFIYESQVIHTLYHLVIKAPTMVTGLVFEILVKQFSKLQR